MGEHNPLTGWFAGVYGGVGYYDLEWHKKGSQGEVYLSTGVSAGYVKALTNSLSLEFSLGVGYLQTDYKRYEAKKDVYDDWTLVHEYNGRYKWFGPTKAKISFIWYPYFKKSSKKGGANE